MMKTIFKIIPIFLAAAFFGACTQMEQGDYMNLSVNSYVFDGNGNDSVVVAVTTNLSEWSVSTDCPFVQVGTPSDNKVVIRPVGRNESSEMAEGVVTFTAGGEIVDFEVMQLPASFKGVFKALPITARGSMSRNGKWFGWVDVTLDENSNWTDHGYLLNLETGETTDLDVPSMPGEDYAEGIMAISDDAKWILFGHWGACKSVLTYEGEVVDVAVPEGMESVWIVNMSADASVLVGNAIYRHPTSGGGVNRPYKYVNGEPIALPCPDSDAYGQVTGDNLPVLARGCSADGSVIYGSEWQTFGVTYWIGEELHNIGVENSSLEIDDIDYYRACILRVLAEYFNMSSDGRYISAAWREFDQDMQDYVDYPAIIDTKTGSYEIYEDAANYGSGTATEDGVLFAKASGGYGCMVFDTKSGSKMTFSEWMKAEHGFIIDPKYYCFAVSDDGLSFSGRFMSSQGTGTEHAYWVASVR